MIKCFMKQTLLVFAFSSTNFFASDDQLSLLPVCAIDTSRLGCSFSQSNMLALFKDSLLVNPLEVLQKAEEVDDCAKNIFSKSLLEDDIEKRAVSLGHDIAVLECINPLFLLRECNSFCYLNRKNNPHARVAYEAKVSKAYIDEIGFDNKPVSYVSFGSGDGFQDLVILTKILAEKPYAKIAIDFIDTRYNRLRSSYWVATEGKDVCWVRDAKTETMSKQLLSFLKNAFSDAEITMKLHASSHDYLSFILNSLQDSYFPVLMHAIDIEEDNAVCEYKNLFFNIVTRHDHARAILCAQVNSKQGISVLMKKSGKQLPSSSLSYNEVVSEHFEEIKIFYDA